MNSPSVKPTLFPTKPTKLAATVQQPVQQTVRQTSATEQDPVRPLRPAFRPPMAILELLDDGSSEGERHRLRADSTTIGRKDVDIVIPHDAQISAAHCRISRRKSNGAFDWVLTDLESTNGIFLRVARCPLTIQTSVMIGCYRYKFRPAGGSDSDAVPAEEPAGTRGWKAPSAAELQRLSSCLLRVNPDGTERPYPLPDGETMLGADAGACGVVIDDDPTVSREHARIRCQGRRMTLEDNNSRNGIWTAITERRLKNNAMFMIGEQRIRFRVL